MIPWEVGFGSASCSELDPVTTECLFRHEIAVRRPRGRQSTGAITRRPLEQSRVPLGIRLRLCGWRRVLHRLDLARSKLRAGWEVRPSFSVSQNGDRAEVLYAIQAYFGCGSIRRMWKHPTGQERQDAQVGSAPPRGSPRPDHPSLRAVAPDLGQAWRLRAVRRRLPIDGSRRSSTSSRSDSDRRARSANEPEREAAIRRGSGTQDAAG